MKILATADSHLGYQQYGLKERRKDFMDAFEQVIDVAIERDVDALVHAGDLFDKKNPSLATVKRSLYLLQKLSDSGIPFLGIEGNHDKQRKTQWLDVFQQLGLATHVVDSPVQGVFGLDFMGRKGVKIPDFDDNVQVLLLHQFIKDDDIPVPEAELSMDDLYGKAPIIILGDYHERKVWRKDGQLIMYVGSTERHSVGETDERSVSIIDTETKELEEITLNTRNFITNKGFDSLKNGDFPEGSVIRLPEYPDEPDVVENELTRQGALKVVFPQKDREEVGMESVDLNFEGAEVDDIVKREMDELSPAADEIEKIIRDFGIVDSNVDDEVSSVI